MVPIRVVKDQQKRKNAGGLQGAEPVRALGLGVGTAAGAGAGTGDRPGLRAKSPDLVPQSTEGSAVGPAQVEVISRKICERSPEKGEAQRGPWPAWR